MSQYPLRGAGSLAQRLAGQGAILFTGYAAAQGLSLIRNAIIGHALSRGDFGIAATITLVLQIVETVTDLGSDRLIMQAKDGDTREFLAASHAVLVIRGALLSAFLLATAPLFTTFFNIPHAIVAFQLIALVPLIKGFLNLDFRRAQRQFDNRPQILIEIAPQALAMVLTVPVLRYAPTFDAVAHLAVFQALSAAILSHALARTPYCLQINRAIFLRQLEFGWPILASSLPLIAVYQGDRVIIGRFCGMESLASYSAAFMITMVPGLIAAKVAHALMLPLFSESVRSGRALARRFSASTEATVLAASIYFCIFAIAGETLIPLVFGAQYGQLGHLTTMLGFMWSLRMIQAVPGMALMAFGTTKPFIVAGAIRASALPIVLAAAHLGAGLAALAAIGCLFELLSLLYVAVRVERAERGLGHVLIKTSAFLLPSAIFSVLVQRITDTALAFSVLAAGCAALAILSAGVSILPLVRANVRLWLANTRAAPIA